MKTKKFSTVLLFIISMFIGACSDNDERPNMTMQEKQEKIKELEDVYGHGIQIVVTNYDSLTYNSLLDLEFKITRGLNLPNKHVIETKE